MLKKLIHITSLLLLIAGLILSQVQFAEVPMNFKQLFNPISGTLLAPLLKPRVSGTNGILKAREHITSKLNEFNFKVDVREFTSETPIGLVKFANVLATRSTFGNKVTLAAHYDSKMAPKGFIGATDSAFPCALLLYMAQLTTKLTPEIDFDLIFFDGEESFLKWTEEDSLYGAKELAPQLERENKLPKPLVLLDLLGNKQQFPIPSWFPETHQLHRKLSSINPKLVGGRPLHEYAGMMQDDHIPFLKLGVPVLHLIPPRFPEEWHTMEDDANFLDENTMEEWAKLMESWLFENGGGVSGDYDF